MYGKSLRTAALTFIMITAAFTLQSTEGADYPGSDDTTGGYNSFFPPGTEGPLVIHTHWGLIDIGFLTDIIPSQATDLESDYWIVQFDGPIGNQHRTEIEEAGASVLGYIPDYAYIIDISEAEFGIIMQIKEDEYERSQKLDQTIEALLPWLIAIECRQTDTMEWLEEYLDPYGYQGWLLNTI